MQEAASDVDVQALRREVLGQLIFASQERDRLAARGERDPVVWARAINAHRDALQRVAYLPAKVISASAGLKGAEIALPDHLKNMAPYAA